MCLPAYHRVSTQPPLQVFPLVGAYPCLNHVLLVA